MTIKEAAAYLRIPLSSFYKLAQDGKVPCRKVGRHWRFHKGALDQWLGLSSQPVKKDDEETQQSPDDFGRSEANAE